MLLLALQESVGTGELIGSNADMGSEVASALPRGGSVEAMSARTGASGFPADCFEVTTTPFSISLLDPLFEPTLVHALP